MQVKIKDGKVIFIHHDELNFLLDLGVPHARRASAVEPSEDGRQWTADLTLFRPDAPVLGPFATRAEALAAEVKWLEEHL